MAPVLIKLVSAVVWLLPGRTLFALPFSVFGHLPQAFFVRIGFLLRKKRILFGQSNYTRFESAATVWHTVAFHRSTIRRFVGCMCLHTAHTTLIQSTNLGLALFRGLSRWHQRWKTTFKPSQHAYQLEVEKNQSKCDLFINQTAPNFASKINAVIEFAFIQSKSFSWSL